MDFFADAEASAAKDAQVVVFVDKRVVALDFRGVVNHRQTDVARIRAECDFSEFATGAVGASSAARCGGSAGGLFLFAFAVFSGIANETWRRVRTHHKLDCAPALHFELFSGSADNHTVGDGGSTRSGSSPYAVDFNDTKAASSVWFEFVVGAKRGDKNARFFCGLQNG